MNHTALWVTIITRHKEAFDLNGNKRTPITVMGNTRTLNTLVIGDSQSDYLMFDKLVLKTSLGDIHFLRHKGQSDGELLVL